MVATVVASTTFAVVAASLDGFALAADAVNLEDVPASRRRRAVVARGIGGGTVDGAWMALVGCRWGQLGRGKSVVAAMNSAGVGRNLMQINRTRNRRRS